MLNNKTKNTEDEEMYRVIKNGGGWRTVQNHGDRPCMRELGCEFESIMQQPDIVVIMFGSNDSKTYQWNEF